jgi:iron complex outermembrane receptor protein
MPLLLTAQTNGKIIGNIIDESSKDVLPGANIVILDTNLGASSDLKGNFEINNVPLGTYRLEFSFVGYMSEIRTDVIVRSSKPAVINVQLKQQNLESEAIVVTAGYFAEEKLTQPSVIGL